MFGLVERRCVLLARCWIITGTRIRLTVRIMQLAEPFHLEAAGEVEGIGLLDLSSFWESSH